MSDYSYSDDDLSDVEERDADIRADLSGAPRPHLDPLFHICCELCSCFLSVTFQTPSLLDQQATVAVLPCNHCFHSVCLDEYLPAYSSSPELELRCPIFKGPSLDCAKFQDMERERLAKLEQQRLIRQQQVKLELMKLEQQRLAKLRDEREKQEQDLKRQQQNAKTSRSSKIKKAIAAVTAKAIGVRKQQPSNKKGKK